MPDLCQGARGRLLALERELCDATVVPLLTRDVDRLVTKLKERRAATDDGESIGHEWDYLAAVAAERWPLLEPALADLDLPALERMAETAAAARDELGPVVDRWRDLLGRAEAQLARDSTLLWSTVDLLVLAILVVAPDPETEAAASRRVNLRREPATGASDVRTGVDIALRLLNSTPLRERVPHDGVPVPPLRELDVAAAVVRQRLSRAIEADELERARALVFGDPSNLWVALSVLAGREYPAAAALAYARLAALVRAAVAGEDPGALDLDTAATELLGAEGAAAFIAAVDALRDGRTPEEIFGNVPSRRPGQGHPHEPPGSAGGDS